MSPPLFVTTKVAEPGVTPVHTPPAVRDGGGGVLVAVAVGVKVGVAVGRNKHEPVTLNVTEESSDVL